MIDGDISTNPGPNHFENRENKAHNLSSLINIQCTPSHIILRQLISMCLLNIQSFKKKSAAFYDYICDCKANLIAVTETWLTVNNDVVRAEIQPPGYKLGGGTALIYHDAFNVSKIDAGEKVSFEFSEWKAVIPSSHDLRIFIIYRPPYSENHKVPSSIFFQLIFGIFRICCSM